MTPATMPAPGLGITMVLGAAIILHGLILLGRRTLILPGELVRKLVHMTTGTLALTFPHLFVHTWPVLVLAGAASLVVVWTRLTPAGRVFESLYGFGDSRRLESLGEFYFALAIGLLFVVARATPVAYAVPLAAVTYGDAAAAIVGKAWGRHRYRTPAGETKSLEGSAAFLLVAAAAGAAAMALTGRSPAAGALPLAGATLVMTALEAVSIRGMDNLAVPAGGWLVLVLLGG